MGWVVRFSFSAELKTQPPPTNDAESAADLTISGLWDLGTTGVFEDRNGFAIAGFATETEAKRASNWLTAQSSVNAATIIVEPAADPGSWSVNNEARLIEVGPVDRRVALSITAGATFGHGGHPTTVLALELGYAALEPGMEVLDLGTGSGVLGIAAAMAGAGNVTAIDIDPEAIKVASTNAEANGVQMDASTKTLAEVMARRDHGFDLIAMNVLLVVQRQLAAEVAGALNPGGHLITSGYLLNQTEEIEELHASAGLVTAERRTKDGWAGHRFTYSPSAARG